MNFTWIFSNGVETVTWGLKRNDFVGVDSDKILVSLSKSGLVPALVPLKYTGRVSGSRSDDLLSGQAIFTLSNISKNDETRYACLIKPEGPFARAFDSVYLLVEGG